MARRNQRRRPDDVKSAAKGFQQVLDPKKAPAGFTEQDILRSRSDPGRYGGIYEGAAPSAPAAPRKAPAAAPAPRKATPSPPRRPFNPNTARDPATTGGINNPADDIKPFGIPPGLQVGQEPFSDKSLPGPLSLPNFGIPPGPQVGQEPREPPLPMGPPPPNPLEPGPGFNPPATLGGAVINQIPATQPNVPMGGVPQPPAAMNTMPRPGISTPGTMPPPAAPAAPMSGMPPGLLDPRLLQAALSGYND